MQGAWLTPEAVPSERERNGHNGECKAELDCLSGDEKNNFERRALVALGVPGNWKDTLRADSTRRCPFFVRRIDWPGPLDSGHVPRFTSIVVPRTKPPDRIQNFSQEIGGGHRRWPTYEKQPGRQGPARMRSMHEGRATRRKKGRACERERLAGDGSERRSASAGRVGVSPPSRDTG